MSRTTLLNLLWRSGHLCDREFTGTAGETISVVSPGEFVDETGVWNTAKIVVDGEIRQGYVAVGEGTPVPDGAILRVVESYVPSVLGIDDRLVPQIECPIDAGVARCYDSLRTGAEAVGCAERIAEMESTHRTFLFSRLLVERLSRKYDDIMRLFGEKDEDWNQTFYTMLLRVMGGDRNREAYMSLASKVDFAMLSREKGDPQRIEALLLGGGGFLFSPGTVKDEYTLRLEDEFRHLAAKYSNCSA